MSAHGCADRRRWIGVNGRPMKQISGSLQKNEIIRPAHSINEQLKLAIGENGLLHQRLGWAADHHVESLGCAEVR